MASHSCATFKVIRRQQVACPPVKPDFGQRNFSDAATIDLHGANYSDWQLCLNEEEARRTAMETRWVGRGRDQAGMGATALTAASREEQRA